MSFIECLFLSLHVLVPTILVLPSTWLQFLHKPVAERIGKSIHSLLSMGITLFLDFTRPLTKGMVAIAPCGACTLPPRVEQRLSRFLSPPA